MWSVMYYRRFEQWDEKCRPYIVDENGNTVVEMPQFVGHPGEYDERADKLAKLIVSAVNSYSDRTRDEID